jgi:Winged helix-turn helix
LRLAQWVFEQFRVSISKPTLSRALRRMGTRQARSAAPVPQARRAQRSLSCGPS